MKSISCLLFLSLCLLFFGCKKEKNRICDLYSGDVGYAVGTIKTLSSTPFKATYSYHYSVAGVDYVGKEKFYGIGQKDETLLGKKFIVVFDADDASNSDLNVDFPIGSESDFTEFTTEYSSGPPPPDFPNKCK